MKYERLTERVGKSICIKETSTNDNKSIWNAIDRLAELEDQIENGTLKGVIRCKDCVYFQPEFVEMENKERRPYTEEEIKNGKIVSMEQGINCGSRCERYRYWDNNSIPVWFNENDFCSYGKLKAEAEAKLKKENKNEI